MDGLLTMLRQKKCGGAHALSLSLSLSLSPFHFLRALLDRRSPLTLKEDLALMDFRFLRPPVGMARASSVCRIADMGRAGEEIASCTRRADGESFFGEALVRGMPVEGVVHVRDAKNS